MTTTVRGVSKKWERMLCNNATMTMKIKLKNKIFELLKNKIQQSKFENLIGFLKQFLNWAVSQLGTRRVSWGVVQNGKFL